MMVIIVLAIVLFLVLLIGLGISNLWKETRADVSERMLGYMLMEMNSTHLDKDDPIHAESFVTEYEQLHVNRMLVNTQIHFRKYDLNIDNLRITDTTTFRDVHRQLMHQIPIRSPEVL